MLAILPMLNFKSYWELDKAHRSEPLTNLLWFLSCSPPRKSLAEGEKFMCSEEKPELMNHYSSIDHQITTEYNMD